MGGVCAFIDAEHAIDPAYARRIGVDIDELLVSQPNHGEQALEIADVLVRSGAIDVIAIDSVAALTPRAELEGQMGNQQVGLQDDLLARGTKPIVIEGQMGNQQVGLQARLMSQALRKLAGNLNRANTVCLFTNQIREKVGVMFGSPETQPGGRALKFYASQRIDIRRIETLKEGTETIGNRVRAKIVKNKVAPPFRQAEFDIEYGVGISSEGCIIDLAVEHGIVRKSGAFFSYGDERLGQGRNNAKAYLREHPDVMAEIEGKIYEALGIDRPGQPAAATANSGAGAHWRLSADGASRPRPLCAEIEGGKRRTWSDGRGRRKQPGGGARLGGHSRAAERAGGRGDDRRDLPAGRGHSRGEDGASKRTGGRGHPGRPSGRGPRLGVSQRGAPRGDPHRRRAQSKAAF
jgi:recombination protein RecA